MKNVELDEIKSYDFNDKLLLVIDSRWKNYFQSEPIFQAIIQNGKLVLVGPNVNRSGPTTDHTTNEADTSE